MFVCVCACARARACVRALCVCVVALWLALGAVLCSLQCRAAGDPPPSLLHHAQFPPEDYADDLVWMAGRSPEEVVSILRRGSVGFARQAPHSRRSAPVPAGMPGRRRVSGAGAAVQRGAEPGVDGGGAHHLLTQPHPRTLLAQATACTSPLSAQHPRGRKLPVAMHLWQPVSRCRHRTTCLTPPAHPAHPYPTPKSPPPPRPLTHTHTHIYTHPDHPPCDSLLLQVQLAERFAVFSFCVCSMANISLPGTSTQPFGHQALCSATQALRHPCLQRQEPVPWRDEAPPARQVGVAHWQGGRRPLLLPRHLRHSRWGPRLGKKFRGECRAGCKGQTSAGGLHAASNGCPLLAGLRPAQHASRVAQWAAMAAGRSCGRSAAAWAHEMGLGSAPATLLKRPGDGPSAQPRSPRQSHSAYFSLCLYPRRGGGASVRPRVRQVPRCQGAGVLERGTGGVWAACIACGA